MATLLSARQFTRVTTRLLPSTTNRIVISSSSIINDRTIAAAAFQSLRRHNFHSEREYHPVADRTLDTILDALDEYCEPIPTAEVTLASGVLTLQLPPHGTWVINKQTPNKQLWWSSPLSGPKRFEYDEGLWYATKDGLNLGSSLTQELQHVIPDGEPLELRV